MHAVQAYALFFRFNVVLAHARVAQLRCTKQGYPPLPYPWPFGDAPQMRMCSIFLRCRLSGRCYSFFFLYDGGIVHRLASSTGVFVSCRLVLSRDMKLFVLTWRDLRCPWTVVRLLQYQGLPLFTTLAACTRYVESYHGDHLFYFVKKYRQGNIFVICPFSHYRHYLQGLGLYGA